jgi:periplasmic divalent cation tolerance protein
LKPVIVVTTVGAGFDPKPLARELIESRLAGCVNIVPGVESIYRWEGAIAEEGEQILLIKTVEERLDELKVALFQRHPYDVPEFVVLAIDQIRGPYLDWLIHSL